MASISLDDIILYAYHGVLKEEKTLGSPYKINLIVEVDISDAMVSDDLTQTVSYAELYEIIKQEMTIKSKLLENVAYRIIYRILKEQLLVQEASISISKIHPPIKGNIKSATVKFQKHKSWLKTLKEI